APRGPRSDAARCRISARPGLLVPIRQPALLKGVAAVLLFGTVPACIRTIHFDSVALGIARLGLAALGMTLVLALAGNRPFGRGRDWSLATLTPLAAIGGVFGVHWLLFFLSIKLASASIGAIGFSTYGVQLALIGWAAGHPRPGWRTAVGVALAMVGSWCCLPAGETAAVGDRFGLGLLLGILCGTAYAVLPLLHQRYAEIDHNVRTWGQFTFGLCVFLACAPAARQWGRNLTDVWMLIHLGIVVTLVGHLLWVHATTELPIRITSVLAYLQLPAALAVNHFAIGEPMTVWMLAGAGCIVAANALALSGQTHQLTPAEVEELAGD
ncbi:MAG: DMT family transporter, partial [Planctomycetales bacterium]|nr:DMT family transporter [Planctomycetales bacterium]